MREDIGIQRIAGQTTYRIAMDGRAVLLLDWNRQPSFSDDKGIVMHTALGEFDVKDYVLSLPRRRVDVDMGNVSDIGYVAEGEMN